MAATASMLFLAAGGTPGRDQLGAIAGGYDACGSGSRRAAQRPQWWVIGCGCCSLLEHRSTDPYALDAVIGTLRNLELLPSDRKSVVSGKGVSGRVDPGGRRITKKNKEKHN